MLTFEMHAQIIEVKIKNVQEFQHPFMSTNDAIKDGLIEYLNAGKTESC